MTELLQSVARDSGIEDIENSLTECLIAKAVSQILYDMMTTPQEDSTLYERAKRSDTLSKLGSNPRYKLICLFADGCEELQIVNRLDIPIQDTLQLICVSKSINKDPRLLYKDIRRALNKNITF